MIGNIVTSKRTPRIMAYFLLLAILCTLIGYRAAESGNVLELDSLKEEYGVDTEYAKMDRLTEDLLRSVRTAQRLGPSRTRRSRIMERLFEDEQGVQRLKAIKPLFPLCDHAIDVKTISLGNLTYAVCLSATRKATLGLITSKWEEIYVWKTGLSKVAEVFSFNDIIYVLIANSERVEGTELLQYNLIEKTVLIDHVVNSQYPTTIALWNKKKYSADYQLAVVNSGGPNSNTLQQNVSIYNWKKTYFDQYSSIIGYDVQDVEPFSIRGRSFLGLSNHRSQSGGVIAESEIFTFNNERSMWTSFQKIRTRGAVDMEFFQIGEGRSKEFFLALANQYEIRGGTRYYNVDSVIYKYAGGLFIPFQCLQTSGITKFTALQGHHFLLIVTNQFGPVQLYQYNGWRFVVADIQYTQQSMGPGAYAASVHQFHHNGELEDIRLVVSNPSKETDSSVFSLVFIHENKLAEWYFQSLQWCNNAHVRLDDTKVQELVWKADHSFMVDQPEPIILNGDILFQKEIRISGTLTTSKLEDQNNNIVYDHSVLNRLEMFKMRLSKLRSRLGHLRELMKSAMKKQGPQTVTGRHYFHSASFHCENSSCNVNAIEAQYLNGDDVSGIRNNVVFLDQNVISDDFHFETLHVSGDVSIGGLIGGVNTSNLVTVNGHHKITASKIFQHVNAERILVGGVIGGVKVASDSVLLNSKDQTFNGEIIVEEIEVETLKIDDLANGINLNNFYENVVLANQYQRITSSKIVYGNVVLDEFTIEPGTTINGISIKEIWDRAIWINEPFDFKLAMNFNSLTLVNPTVLSINGISFNGGEVVLLNQDNEITAEKTFTASRNAIDNLHVAGNLNGIETLLGNSDWPDQLDILVKSKPQIVQGNKILSQLTLSGNSTIRDLFAGVNVAELVSKVLHRNKNLNLTGEWSFNRVDFRGPLEVRGVLEGLDVQKLYERALKINEPLPSTATVIFSGLVTVDDLECHNINTFDVSKDFIHQNGSYTVFGQKSFSSMVLTKNSHLNGSLNGVPLQFIDDTLLTINNQIVASKKVIKGDLIVQDLILDSNTINGVQLDKVVLADRNTDIEGSVEFLSNIEVFNGIIADAVQVQGMVNSVELFEVAEDALLYSGSQQLMGEVVILGDVTILPNIDLPAPVVNGIPLKDFAKDIICYDQPRLITGKKTFITKTAKFENLIVFGSIDGISGQDITNNWMLHDEAQIINGNVKFGNNLLVKESVMVPTVQGIDIIELAQETIHLGEPIDLYGTINIKNIVIKSDLTLTGLIQDVNMSEVIRKNSDNIIIGHKWFTSEITSQSMNVEGFVDNVKVEDFCKNIFTRNSEDQISSLTINGNLVVEGELVSSGKISGIDLVHVNNTLLRIDHGAVIENRVFFDELFVEEEMLLTGLMNGISVQALGATYLSASLDQVVPASMNFGGPLLLNGNLFCHTVITEDHHIGELNLEELYSTILKIEGEQTMTGELRILGDLHVKGDLVIGSRNVSGVIIPEGLALKTRANTVSGPLIIENDIRVMEEIVLNEGTTIQEVDVSDWAQSTVYKNGKFILTGKKTFDKLTVVDARANQFIGGTEITTSNLLLTEGSQTILNSLHSFGPLTTRGEVIIRGKVSGIDVIELHNSVILKDFANVVEGRMIFQSDLRINHMTSYGSIDTVNISLLTKHLEEPVKLYELQEHLGQRQLQIDWIRENFEQPKFHLMYYEEVQRLTTLEVLSFSSGTTLDGRHLLFMADSKLHINGCIPINVMVFNAETGLYVPLTTFHSGMVVAMDTFVMDDLYIALANVRPWLECHLQSMGKFNIAGGLQIYRWRNATFEFVESRSKEMVLDVAVVKAPISQFAACLLVTFSDRVEVLCSLGSSKPFKLLQAIISPLVKGVSSAECGDYPIIALANPSTSSVDVYVWDYSLNTFRIFQRVEAFPDTSMVLIPLLDGAGQENCLLVIGDRSARPSSIHVYRFYAGNGQKADLFSKIQTRSSPQITSMRWLPLTSDTVLLFVLSRDFVNVLSWQGAIGFGQFQKFNLPAESNVLHVLNRAGDPRSSHYLIASGRVCISSIWQQESYSIILKAVSKGC